MKTAMRTLRAILFLLLTVCLTVTAASAAEIVSQGSCGAKGSDVTWTLDSAGTLTISGTGAMATYDPELDEFYVHPGWPRSDVKKVIIQAGVTDIGENAFSFCGNLQSILIPNTVTRIGHAAFYECTSLESIVIPDSVTFLNNAVFYGCSSLRDVTLPGELTDLSQCLFNKCTALESFTVPEGVTAVDDFVFMGCSSLKTIEIPAATREIGRAVFAGCGALEQITVARDNPSLAVLDDILYGSTFTRLIFCPSQKSGSLTSIPDTVTDIDELAFFGCSKLTGVTLPEGLQSIGGAAFAKCSGLREVSIPDGVRTLPAFLLIHSRHDPSVYSGELFKEYCFGTFDGCSSLERVRLPDSLSYLDIAAFRNCTSLASVELPASLSVLQGSFHRCDEFGCDWYKAGAFENCDSLTSVTIPAGVTDMYNYTFSGCDSLSAIYFMGDPPARIPEECIYEDPPVESLVIPGPLGVTVYYPDGSPAWESHVSENAKLCAGWKAYTPLKITAQPRHTYADLGSTASVSVTAQGDGLTYRWFVRDLTDTRWYESKHTTGTYKLTLTEENAGREAYCEITDQYGHTVCSDTAQLRSTFAITAQPKTAYAAYGNSVKTTVRATGDGLTYTWYVRDVEDDKYFESSIKQPTYSMKTSEANSNRRAYCVVKDRYGNSLKTNTVRLRMSATVTGQPAHASADLGSVAKTTVTAKGDGLTYQWYIKNPGSSGFSKSSVTSATYSMKLSESNKGRQVYCIVKDTYGKTAKTDTVTFGLPVKIIAQPKPAAVLSGATVRASVKATGDDLRYQWYIKNPGKTTFGKSSVTSAAYSCKMSASVNGRQIYCVVSDRYGNSVQSDTVTLSMKAALAITQQPKSVTVAQGETARVTLTATGEGLSYKWYFKNAGASKFSLTTSFTGNSYSVSMTPARSGRQVYCVVSDSSGNSVRSDTVTLSMEAPIVITAQPADASAAEGSVAKTTVKADGDGLRYQWYIKNPGKTAFSKSSVTSATYSCKMSQANDGRQAYCLITDADGNTLKTRTVTFTLK